LEKVDWHRALAAAIDGLSEEERVFLLLHCGGECNLREIGIRVGLSESRVCRMLGRSVRQFRSWMPAMEAGDDFDAYRGSSKRNRVRTG
jgi:DNA-directed RNA polymerase specialized sigma subunit